MGRPWAGQSTRKAGDAEIACRASSLESARFGRSIERLTITDLDDVALPAVGDAVRGSAADIVILRYPADRVGWFARLARTPGRDAIFADCLTYWRLRPGTGRAPRASRPPLTCAELSACVSAADSGPDGHPAADPVHDPVAGTVAGTVGALVTDIFAGYGTHYLADPLLDPSAVLAGYREWAVRSARAGGCLILREQRSAQILALATLEESGPTTEILLAGVVSRAQGRGLYAHLLKGVEERAMTRGAAWIEISTQAHNTRVQRAWARYGFEPVRSMITVHLLRTPLARTAPAGRG